MDSNLVEDNAQAPLGAEDGCATGTVGHIGVFSLNYHKHIHTGEGGMCVTSDTALADRMRLIRNHGENIVESAGIDTPINIVGFNYRMTELSAAVGLAQLAAIDAHVALREKLAAALTAATADLDGLTPPIVRPGCRHNYYIWLLKYDAACMGVGRATFSRALEAEGFPHAVGYLKPLYTLPLFQKRLAIGREGFPFTLTERKYDALHLPVVERLHRDEAVLFEPCAYAIDDGVIERLCEAIRKVHRHRDDLVRYERLQAA